MYFSRNMTNKLTTGIKKIKWTNRKTFIDKWIKSADLIFFSRLSGKNLNKEVGYKLRIVVPSF